MLLQASEDPASVRPLVVQAVDRGTDSQLWRLIWVSE